MLSYPIRAELDYWIETKWQNDLYFMANSICDFIHYFVLVLAILIIDVYTVVKLRRTLTEKSEKFAKKPTVAILANSIDEKKLKQISEFDDVINRAIKMVVLNNAFGVLFKLPVSIKSILLVMAELSTKYNVYNQNHPALRIFFINIVNSWLFNLIPTISDFMFSLTLFLQIYVYLRFDKRFKAGYWKIFSK